MPVMFAILCNVSRVGASFKGFRTDAQCRERRADGRHLSRARERLPSRRSLKTLAIQEAWHETFRKTARRALPARRPVRVAAWLVGARAECRRFLPRQDD